MSAEQDIFQRPTPTRELYVAHQMTGEQFEAATSWMKQGDSVLLVLPSGKRVHAILTDEGRKHGNG